VKKEDYPRRDYFDVWLPELAPSAGLVSWALAKPFTPPALGRVRAAIPGEMRRPPARRLVGLLAALSPRANFAVGCYCADESRCHRSLLRALLLEEGATVV